MRGVEAGEQEQEVGVARRGGIVASRVPEADVVRAGIFVGLAARRASVGVSRLGVWVRLPPVPPLLPFGGVGLC